MSFLCPLHSWTTGEEMAKDILQHRYYLTVKHQHKHTVCGFYYKEKGEENICLYVRVFVCVCVGAWWRAVEAGLCC